jgi:hypothetical protein
MEVAEFRLRMKPGRVHDLRESVHSLPMAASRICKTGIRFRNHNLHYRNCAFIYCAVSTLLKPTHVQMSLYGIYACSVPQCSANAEQGTDMNLRLFLPSSFAVWYMTFPHNPETGVRKLNMCPEFRLISYHSAAVIPSIAYFCFTRYTVQNIAVFSIQTP